MCALPIARGLAAAFLALLLASVPCGRLSSEPAPGVPPEAVMEAIGDAPAPDGPTQVVVGAYINDIQQLDFKANNYAVDLYVWFRWKGPELEPSKSMEFMNRYAADDKLREALYDKPEAMPDGSLYAIIRYQGRFASKFELANYPFDTQVLSVVLEDAVSGTDKLVYVPDGEEGVTVNPVFTLAGFSIGKPTMDITSHTYPTNFGDVSQPNPETYSRIALSIPVARPIAAMSIKTFVPILLIVACGALVFFVRPRYVEGRIGLGITALLTLVALQLTAGASLPDVDARAGRPG